MSSDKESRSFLDRCEVAYAQGRFEYVIANAKKLSDILADPSILYQFSDEFLEFLGKYDEALEIAEKNRESRLKHHSGNPNWKGFVKSHLNKFRELKKELDEKVGRIKFKKEHRWEYNYCAAHKKPLILDKICPISKKRIISPQKSFYGGPKEVVDIYKTQFSTAHYEGWKQTDEIDCFAARSLSIIEQFDNTAVFSGTDLWKVQFTLKNLNSSLYDLKFELESCEFLKFIKGLVFSADRKLFCVLDKKENLLKQKNGENKIKWVLNNLESGDTYFLYLEFQIEMTEGIEKTYMFEHLLTVHYDTDSEDGVKDVSRPIKLTIYPSLNTLFTTLLNYLQNYTQVALPYDRVRRKIEEELNLKLNEEILKTLINLMSQHGILQYEVVTPPKHPKSVEVILEFPDSPPTPIKVPVKPSKIYEKFKITTISNAKKIEFTFKIPSESELSGAIEEMIPPIAPQKGAILLTHEDETVDQITVPNLRALLNPIKRLIQNLKLN